MSWSNVMGIDKFQIWGESNTTSQTNDQTYLFVNGQHQVKIFVGLSFMLQGTTLPSSQEVMDGLCLINDTTGLALQHLQTGKPGAYTSVFSPSLVQSVQSTSAALLKQNLLGSAQGDGANGKPYTVTYNASNNFPYIAEFYVSSNTSINSGNASETISVKLNYKDSSGTNCTSSLAANNYDTNMHDSVRVNCYKANMYADMIELKKDESSLKYNKNTLDSRCHDFRATASRLHFKGNYFYIHDYSNPYLDKMKGVYNIAAQNLECCPTAAVGYGKWDRNDTYYTDVYCSTDKMGMGKKDYTFKAYQWRNSVNDLYDRQGYLELTINQGAHEIVFPWTSMSVSKEWGWEIDMRPIQTYIIMDQFGNKYNVNIVGDWNGTILSPVIDFIG